MNNNFELPPDLFADDIESRIPNDENEDIKFLIVRPITPKPQERTANTLYKVLVEVEQYIKSLDDKCEQELDSEFEQEILNGPNVQDCYKPLEVKIPIGSETQVNPDSPGPIFSQRPII